jgi:hypothetical protein
MRDDLWMNFQDVYSIAGAHVYIKISYIFQKCYINIVEFSSSVS